MRDSAAVTGAGLPRARGDRPVKKLDELAVLRSAPRTRGSTRHVRIWRLVRHVCPAHAGIDLPETRARSSFLSLPRARGDRPAQASPFFTCLASAPRTRGSTPDHRAERTRGDVCPAHAGIDPHRHRRARRGSRLPRARGDRPDKHNPGEPLHQSARARVDRLRQPGAVRGKNGGCVANRSVRRDGGSPARPAWG